MPFYLINKFCDVFRISKNLLIDKKKIFYRTRLAKFELLIIEELAYYFLLNRRIKVFNVNGEDISLEQVQASTVAFIDMMKWKGWDLRLKWVKGEARYTLYDTRHHADAVTVKGFDDAVEKWGYFVGGGAMHAAQFNFFSECIESDSYSKVKGALAFIETGRMTDEIRTGVAITALEVNDMSFDEKLHLASNISSRYGAVGRRERRKALRDDLRILKDRAVGRCLELSTEVPQVLRQPARI